MKHRDSGARVKGKLVKLSQQHRRMGFVLAFAVVGSVLLLITHAAAPYASVNVSQGALTGGANIISDARAFNGQAVQFGSATTATVNPPTQWTNITGNLANMASDCGNLTMLSAVPNSSTIIAGVSPPGNGGGTPLTGGLWASNNGGASWTHLGAGAGSDTILNRPNWIAYDPSNNATFWEAGIYGPNFGIFATTDGGNTFHHLGTVFHNDSIGVDFTGDDPVPRQILVAGGHERTQYVFKSTDGGQTWANIGANIPAGTGFTQGVVVINSQTYIVNATVSFSGGSAGIYRTTNGGSSWTQVSTQDPTEIPLVTSNGTIYWASGSSLLKSTDSGVTWTTVGSGLQYGFHPIELPDGRLVSSNNNNLVVSADGGNTWTVFGANFPYQPADVIYSTGAKAFFISHSDCGTSVLSDAVMKGM